ncbi:Transcription factor rfx3 [Cichlidogyrus casuarinus]|uniref:Transcription factor rfx3 n=1 Tax=Cichlidogyrus casuarinus TaxID=1844966 RepID=A0ABD2QAS0_9PLAT
MQTSHVIVGKASAVLSSQNGPSLVVGKLSGAGNSDTVTIQDANNAGQTIQTIYSANSYQDSGAEQTVYSNNNPSGNNHIPLLDLVKKSIKAKEKRLKPGSDEDDAKSQYSDYLPVVYTTSVAGQQTYYPAQQIITDASGGNNFNSHNLAPSGTLVATHQGGTTYVLQQQAAIMEDDSASLCHAAKASPVTIHWLTSNYETSEGVSLPRSTLYFHYLQHCNEHKLEPMNPASFGKLIRSVFVGLRTRRLGTRGNSKYHYYGIRIKPESPLNHYVEDSNFSMRPYHMGTPQSGSSCYMNDWRSSNSSERYSSTPGPKLGTPINGANFSYSANANEAPVTSGAGGAGGPSFSANAHQHAHFLGETSSALPNLEEICRSAGLPIPPKSILDHEQTVTDDSRELEDGSPIPEGCNMTDIMDFCRIYAESAEDMLNAVVNLDFADICSVWKNFWRTEDDELEMDPDMDTDSGSGSKTKLQQLVAMPHLQQFIRMYDHTFYQSLAEVLIPNVLRAIPPALTQAIRNFAKSLEGWMRSALSNLDPELVRIKLSAVSALAQTLRRYTSLNHLAQAARTVLKNGGQVSQMLADLNRVDFGNVQEQASWICLCSDSLVSHLEQEFKRILQRQASLEEWAHWLDSVVTSILQPHEASSGVVFARAAHQLVLKWSFYSSMLIRDLTLRSAASFGSFHLIRLLYDEYIFYLIEHKVAAHLGMTPVAVMGEMGRSLIHKRSPKKKVKRPNGTEIEASNTPDSVVGPSGDNFEQEKAARSGVKRAMIKTLDESDLEAGGGSGVDLDEEEEEAAEDSESDMLRQAHADALQRCAATKAVTVVKLPDDSHHPGKKVVRVTAVSTGPNASIQTKTSVIVKRPKLA